LYKDEAYPLYTARGFGRWIKLYFQVEAVYALPLFVNYMFDKCIRYDVFNCSPTGLSELYGKQLDFILEILNGPSQVSSADSAAVK